MMQIRTFKPACLAIGLFLGLATFAHADVKLASLFRDHMVLQRDAALPVWGWADPAETVTVMFGPQAKTTKADKNGQWAVRLDPTKAGGPFVMRVRGKNFVEVKDVLVGEVWLCSGQSNMGMTVSGCINKDQEIAAANHPKIRMYIVGQNPTPTIQTECKGEWHVCSPETVGRFSAAAYFFGRDLHKELDVPVGLINSSWGGTPIQAWTSIASHEAVAELKPMLESLKKAIETYDPAKAKAAFDKQTAEWKARQAKAKAENKPFKERAPRLYIDPQVSQGSPGRLFNGMIAPLYPFAIRGAIWYQGEANASNPALYAVQLKTMIAEWRKCWNQGDFPFLFVQLPNYMAAQTQPSEKGWPGIRETFFKALTAIPNTGMAITIDVGEAEDIHPKNKQAVGYRLAQWALAKIYDKKVVASGPLYRSMKKDGDRITIEFDYSDGLKTRDNGKVKGFAIAGDDKKFVWASAEIKGNTVVVSSPEIKSPASVRYAWANNPEVNLVNGADLPVSPFRTDEWAE